MGGTELAFAIAGIDPAPQFSVGSFLCSSDRLRSKKPFLLTASAPASCVWYLCSVSVFGGSCVTHSPWYQDMFKPFGEF